MTYSPQDPNSVPRNMMPPKKISSDLTGCASASASSYFGTTSLSVGGVQYGAR
jgi:hypothetical protein